MSYEADRTRLVSWRPGTRFAVMAANNWQCCTQRAARTESLGTAHLALKIAFFRHPFRY